MGSGKTTLGRALHGLVVGGGIRLRFVDLDEEIERSVGATVTEIFKDKGESCFREIEATTLRTIGGELPVDEILVVACGGGTPCYSDNMSWMNAHGLTVLLQASDAVLERRLVEGAYCRPLLTGLDSATINQLVSRLQAQRMPVYNQALLTFQSDYLENEHEIEQSVNSFLHLINQFYV